MVTDNFLDARIQFRHVPARCNHKLRKINTYFESIDIGCAVV